MTEFDAATFVLREFRLAAPDADGAIARIVAATPGPSAPAVPLLTSIDDHRDVATIERVHDAGGSSSDDARHALLDPFVVAWRSAKEYVPRISERSDGLATHYRLAVTESGINDEKREPSSAPATDASPEAAMPFDLLWIGQPVASYAGLLIVLGTHGASDTPSRERTDWPLLMSRRLGVRIYDSSG